MRYDALEYFFFESRTDQQYVSFFALPKMSDVLVMDVVVRKMMDDFDKRTTPLGELHLP